MFERGTRKFFLAWRQVGARRDEHAKVCSLCWPLLLESQHWAAVAHGSRLHAKSKPALAPISVIIPFKCTRHRPNFMPMQPSSVPNSPELHATATHMCHDFGQYSTQMQPKPPDFRASATKFCAEFVRIPSTCNPNRPKFMPTSHIEEQVEEFREIVVHGPGQVGFGRDCQVFGPEDE